MRNGERRRAALGTVAFLVVAPGVMAGVVPHALTGWEPHPWPLPGRLAGALVVVAGLAVLLHAFARFVTEGLGTPAPVAPTKRLVVGGAYRFVRNPMYLAVAAVIMGQALLLGATILLPYALAFVLVVAGFVHLHEEPTLRNRYGDQYEDYCRAVPAWLPRRTPWDPG